MDRCPAPSPQPAMAALYGPPLAGALVVPTEGGMVMSVNDDLLARADKFADGIASTDEDSHALVADLAAALRAALAAQSTITDMHAYGDCTECGVSYGACTDPGSRLRCCSDCNHEAVAGSATPTGDDDG